METDKLASLYALYDQLTKAEKESKLEENQNIYEKIIGLATTGDSQEKRLVSQFIAKFFKHYPNCEISAVQAQIELCDDPDIAVRKQAIHDLPFFCQRGADDPYIPRIAIVLSQLLTVDDKNELSIVEKSLNTLLRQSVTATIKGIFGQMNSSVCEDALREACIKFLCSKINLKTLDKDTETLMLEEAAKVCPSLSGEEFILMLKLLAALKISKLVVNQQILLKMIADQAQINQDGDFDAEHIIKLKACIPLALPFFTPFAPSLDFIAHIINNFLPTMDPSSEDSVELLKLVAQMSPQAIKPIDEQDDETKKTIESISRKIFDKVIELVPSPPADDNIEKEPDLPTLHLNHLECLLYTFHQMSKKLKPAFLDDEDTLKDVRLRLQYLARGLQIESKKLKTAISEATKLEDEKKNKATAALKITNNLTAFIKDWFHNPPVFKSNVTLSFLQEAPAANGAAKVAIVNTPSGDGKRKAIVFDKEETNGSSHKKPFKKESREIYRPPRGGHRGRGRGRGNFRNNRW